MLHFKFLIANAQCYILRCCSNAGITSGPMKIAQRKLENQTKLTDAFFNKINLQLVNKTSTNNAGSTGAPGNKKSDHSFKKPISECNSTFIVNKCDIYKKPKANSEPFRILSYFMLPIILVYSNYILTQHEEEEKEQFFVPYEYMYKRLKRFAWGEGRKSFFHGPYNFIPEEEQHVKRLNKWDIEKEMRKALRDQHAKEELLKRQLRHRSEANKLQLIKNEE
uniref:Uncharacterized protein n=1 Tax=Stomoxys calcitrans TaxID=35570 RepID=A0A1I8NXL6_STOCA